ncbi:MAG: MaoC family dehydratase [Acetobacteraceae bacterium]|nr:MaoC family dehydratase [Acetobacteraceae bacterium]MBV8525148.1 MaoC family dehydratase [Acetobacteraceae bacterium]MBV8589265.1 MaoC family dehydratase [Acetobacteraceae bacterium]
MLEVETPAAMADYAGKKLGSSDWVLIDQAMIHRFADATGDHQWIHVDTERARREMPGGKTIAHGFLTLSLLPRLSDTVYSIRKRSRGINYGANKVRFTAPVPSGSRIRLHQTLKAAEPVAGGQKLIFESTVEVEGQARPALFAETIVAVYD